MSMGTSHKTTGQRPKKSRRERMVALVACLLALLLLLPMVVMVVENIAVAGAASVSSIQSEINTLKGKNSTLAKEKAGLQKELAGLQAEKGKAMDKKTNLERQINVLQDEIDNLDAQLEQYTALITEKENEVAENEEKERQQFALFQRQCRAMEKEGRVSYWSILFSAKSFQDLLDKVHTVNSIADYNDMVCDQLQQARAALKQAKAELESAKAETEETRAAREAAQNELESQKAQVQALINEIAADEKQTKAALDELNAAAAAMDKEIAKKEKELQQAIAEANRAAASGGGGGNTYQFDPGSGFYWPLPASSVKITSFYGPRRDPITGKSANHSGTDIGSAPTGTPIYAAHGGVVLTSASHSSYGNYVVLSRGDGITTLYAHMSRRAVSVGQVVSQGQVIGYVGSTGRSTGPHLHFEVRVNGARQDALKYYPNVKWINATGFPYK